MRDYLIYDCEIVRCIPSGQIDERYEYCKGWTDFQGMGISVVGFYSSLDGIYGICTWEEEEIDRVVFQEEVAKASVAIGFNSRRFDDALMAANGCRVTTDYDLLEEIRIAAGFGAHWQSVPKGYSYSLDAIAKANGMAKTGSGSLAPALWQDGKRQEVADYCLNDVKLTHSLLNLGLEGRLIDPNTGNTLQVRAVEDVKKR